MPRKNSKAGSIRRGEGSPRRAVNIDELLADNARRRRPAQVRTAPVSSDTPESRHVEEKAS